MRAAVFHGPPWPQKLMTIEELPMPAPGPGEVLIKVAAGGVCRTDLEYLKGDGPTPKPPPLVLGHEPVGTIAGLGEGVKGFQIGQRVVMATNVPCTKCEYCRSGHENQCPNTVIPGATQNGCFAEYFNAPAVGVYPLPDSLPLEESAALSDAVSTCYHAIFNRARVKAGDSVAVFGASGGLGLICIQFIKFLGANPIGIGRKLWKLDKAKELGASQVFSTDETDRVDRTIKKLTAGGVDISMDVTGIPSMIELACRSTRTGGKVVVAGFSFHKVPVEVNRLVWNELDILGSKSSNAVEMPKIIKLVEQGAVDLKKIISHRFKLEEVNEAYQMLDKGEVLRAIVIP